jgi:PPK2 family polyphosphate:nucleotide phosphotransferase
VFEAVASPFLVPFDDSFRVSNAATEPPKNTKHKESRHRLEDEVAKLSDLAQKLYADDRFALLLVFQAMDAAGKDGTIRAALSGVSPSAVQVFSFKQPSAEELDHDFLWRTARCLPERGRIGVFNRSYYEEVLVVRVHPEFLEAQRLPYQPGNKKLWKERYESIRDHELHLARNGTVVLKFWLNVSKGEQRRRFLSRLEQPEKNWKFSPLDAQERQHWKTYMGAYEDALRATSRSWAPWYAIPADDKEYMRVCVAEIIVKSLDTLGLRYPKPPAKVRADLAKVREMLSKGAS